MMDIVERLRTQQMVERSFDLRCEAADEIESLRQQLETERMRLAACGVAALGYFEGCEDEYRSASLEDVLRLRAEYDNTRHASDASAPRRVTSKQLPGAK